MIAAGHEATAASRQGLLSNALILLGWLISLVSLLGLDLQQHSWWSLGLGVLLRTLLQTGLFILAHDAMHGLIWPERPQGNHAIGVLLLFLYAGLGYAHCLSLHHNHHRFAGTCRDPDFCPNHQSGLLAWYVQFMSAYLSAFQMLRLLGSWAILVVGFSAITPTAPLNVLLFCTLPLLFSSWQLFLVGTYLPHRVQQHPSCQPQPASLNLPVWFSLLACFHFGYHREHHDNPGLSWFQLPSARRHAQKLANRPGCM